MHEDIDLTVDVLHATADVEREGVGFYVSNLTVWLDILGKEFAIEVPPAVEEKIREMIILQHENNRLYVRQDDWKDLR